MNIHNDYFAFEEGDGRAVNLRGEVPACESLALLLVDRPIVIVDGNGAVVELHVKVVGVERGCVVASIGRVVDREGSRALGN